MLGWLNNWWNAYKESRKVLDERSVIVRTDLEGISAKYPNGEISSIRWDAVNIIAIDTNDSGPWGYDVWWVFEGSEDKCVYPGGSTGDLDALKVLEEKFPGFRDDAVIKAMGSTSNNRFVCWEKDNAP